MTAATDTMPALLPCPFCGDSPSASSRPDGEGLYVAFVACFCGGYSACAHKMGDGVTPTEAEANAASLWNTRAKAKDTQ